MNLPIGLLALLLTSPLAIAAVPPQEVLGFDVAPSDEPSGADYTWHQALSVCEDKGMVLPTAEEMARMYCHARLGQRNIDPDSPDGESCAAEGFSESLPNFKEQGRYWTSSQYNDGIVRYIDFLDGKVGYYGKGEKLRVRCILPDDRRHTGEFTPVYPYNINDVDEESFDYIIDTIVNLHQEDFDRAGRELVVDRRWEDHEENARSWFMEQVDGETQQIREVREIELVGGLARHPMLNRDAYALVVCHELGHHIGGAPHALGYSSEGQSDYFASAKCMKRYLKTTRYEQHYDDPVPDDLAAGCAASYRNADDRAVCRRNILAGLTLARWIAHSRATETPHLTRQDPVKRTVTLEHGYPAPQCRLDTLVAGALCPVDDAVPFSDADPRAGACTREAGHDREARPRCWFNMETLLQASPTLPEAGAGG